MHLGQRRHLNGVIHDEGWLHKVMFALLTEEFVDQFSLAHRSVCFQADTFASRTKLFFVLSIDVNPGVFPDGIAHTDALVRRREIDVNAVQIGFGTPVNGLANVRQKLLGGFHHPVVIFVGNVEFQNREFRVVGAVHSFVAEVPREFKHPFEPSDDQAFQVEFIGNAQIECAVQCVVVRDEWPGGGPSRNGLQHGRVHLQPPFLVK